MVRLPSRAAALLLATTLLTAAVPAARADEFLNRANQTYAGIRQSKRSDLVLLPVLAKTAPPPAAVSTSHKAMLLPHGAEGWDAAEAWANAPEQRAVLEAIDKVTQESNPVEAMVFAQPYGYEGVPIELVRAGLYTEVGDPPMLAGAKFNVLEWLDRAAILVNVEATRLAAAQEEAAAIDLLIDWLYFSRQMADRVMFTEFRWGVRSMIATLERIRDVAYTDFRYGDQSLTVEQMQELLKRIETGGYINPDRLRLPEGDQAAAKQMLARAFTPRQGPNPDTFGPLMAKLSSSERPLRLFSEAARWDRAGQNHANAFDVEDQINKIFGDWKGRWALSPMDPRMAEVFEYDRMNKSRFQAVVATVPNMTVLFNDRQVLRAQLVGTRTALGVLAFYYNNKNFPPAISSIRPRFVREIEADPFNPNTAAGQQPPMMYFVPNRINYRRPGPREEAKPHQINVFTQEGAYNFRILVGDDQFVLYSLGPDKAAGFAELVSGEPAQDAPGDLLVWPPVISLERQHLTETGQLK